MSIESVLNCTKQWTAKHSPELLVAFGITSMVSAVAFSIKATPKAVAILEKMDEEATEEEPVEPVDKAKAVIPIYIPTIIATGVGIACIIGASRINMHRNAVLAAAYTMSETTLAKYSDKIIEEFGKEKADEIRKATEIETMKDNPPPKEVCSFQNAQVSDIMSKKLFFETLSGRYFYSSVDNIKKAENEFNRLMRDECFMSMNDWFDMIGLDSTSLGDDLGWNIDTEGYVDLTYTSKLDENLNSAIVIGYTKLPKPLHSY